MSYESQQIKAVLAGGNNGKILFNDIEQVLPIILNFVRGWVKRK